MLRGPVKREVRLPYCRKLMRIVKIRVNLSCVNFRDVNLCAALISALLISSILTPILELVQTFLTP